MEDRLNVTGTVGIPVEYFLRMAKHDYSSYRNALPREFFQNSSDAGAKNIWVDSDEERRTITIRDDGHGMDLDTLQNKLLVLGGSKKRKGATGAFGKAKELLFFSWEWYEIKTRNLHCYGQGAEYTIGDRSKSEDHNTTECIITIPESENFSYIENAFWHVARKFEIDAKIHYNGNEVQCELHAKTLLKETKWATVYVDDSRNSFYMQARINGQWMFESYTGVDDIGTVIVEINKQSTEILTSNRDGVKSKYHSEFNNLVKEIIKERKDFIKPPVQIVREKISGTGSIKINWHRAKKAVKEVVSNVRATIEMTTEDAIAMLGELVDVFGSRVALLRSNPIAQELSRDPRKVFDFEDRLKFLGYTPDFIVLYDKSRKPRGISDISKVRKLRVLAYIWTEMVKQVLMDIDWVGEFNCGFNFVEDTVASHELDEDGVHYFHINPNNVLKEAGWIKSVFQNKTLLERDLRMSACHEVAHIFEKYHDTDFVSKFHWIHAQTWKSDKIYAAIVKEGLEK